MAQVWKVLGKAAPANTTEVAVGAAIAASHTYQVKLWIANRTASPIVFRVRHAYADAAAANDQYLAYGASCPANDFIVLPQFILETTDKLYVVGDTGLTFIAYALDMS
jgi:hypothetical protein